MRVSEATAAYITQLEGDGRSIHTVKQAARFLRKLSAELHDPPIATVKHEDLARFLASGAVTKRADGGARKANSANALRSVVRSFFAFSHAAGYCTMNPARLIRRARCAPPRPKGLSDGDATKFLAALDTASTRAEKRDRAMFRTMLGLGLRVGSVVALDVDDLDFDNAELRVRVLKNRDQDVLFVPPELVAMLRDYIGKRTAGPLFPDASGYRIGTRQVGRRLEAWSARAGIKPTSPHTLRHRFAMTMYERTRDVLLVGRLLCHRSVASTATYARPSMADVRKVMGAG